MTRKYTFTFIIGQPFFSCFRVYYSNKNKVQSGFYKAIHSEIVTFKNQNTFFDILPMLIHLQKLFAISSSVPRQLISFKSAFLSSHIHNNWVIVSVHCFYIYRSVLSRPRSSCLHQAICYQNIGSNFCSLISPKDAIKSSYFNIIWFKNQCG